MENGENRNVRRRQTPPASRNDQLRHSKSGRKRRAKRRETLLVGSAVTLLLAMAILCFLFLFRVQDIVVTDTSQQRYTNAQIAEASEIRIGESLFFLKTDAAAERIERALPYIETASVKRGFPTSAQITVSYARPAMAIYSDGGYIILSAKGKVLQTGAPAVSDYVAELLGVTVVGAVPGEYVAFAEEGAFENVTSLAGAFAKAGYLNVTAYDVRDPQNIVVEVDYKIDVKLGNVNRVEEKLAFGKEVLLRTLEDARRSPSKIVVDLTTENTAFVRSQRDIDEAASEAHTTLAEEGSETGIMSDAEILTDAAAESDDG